MSVAEHTSEHRYTRDIDQYSTSTTTPDNYCTFYIPLFEHTQTFTQTLSPITNCPHFVSIQSCLFLGLYVNRYCCIANMSANPRGRDKALP